jgi:PKD repeat protein
MKQLLSVIFLSIFGFGVLHAQPPVDVWQVVAPTNPLNCTNTNLTITGWNDAGNYVLTGITHTYGNDTIWVDINYTSPQIVIGVLTSWSHNVSLGNVPYGNWTVAARGYLGNVWQSVAYGWLPVGACCPTAIPQFSFVEDTVCVGAQVSVTNNSIGSNLSYAWDLPDGTSTAQSPTFTVSEAGTYDVTLTVTGDSCSDSLVKVLEVLDLPFVDLGNDTTICEGDSLPLSLAVGNDYLWSDGNTTYSNAIHGIGSLSVTVTDGNGCMESDTVAVLAELQTLSISLGPDQTICPEDQAQLNAGNTGTSYVWSNGDTTQMTTTSSSGLISVTVSENGYCDGIDELNIQHHSVIQSEIELAEDSCGSRIIWVDASHTVQNWFNGSDSMAVEILVSDGYTVTALDGNGCLSEDSVFVYVAELPVFSLGNDTFLCANQTITFFTGVTGDHLWNTGAAGSAISVAAKGKYSVTVTTDEGCTYADTVRVNHCLGTETITESSISIFPTVVDQKLFVRGVSNNTTARIYDALGALISEQKISYNELNLSELTTGVYFLKVDGHLMEVKRFIKQ